MFELYPPLLMLSGILLLVNAALPWQTVGTRILNVLLGLVYIGYGFYLEFIFTGGEYRIFIYAFIVPILMIVQTVRSFKAWQAQKAAQPAIYPGAQYPAPPPGQYPPQYGQPPAQYGQPAPQQQYGQQPSQQYGGQYGQPGQYPQQPR
jgi:hypothetical protein